MNIHYAFSIRSDGGDDDSDDDEEDVDKGGDNADYDGEDENLLFLFSREVSEVVDSDQTLQVILFLKSKIYTATFFGPKILHIKNAYIGTILLTTNQHQCQ